MDVGRDQHVVPAVFRTRKEADAVIDDLKEIGVPEDLIGVVRPDQGLYSAEVEEDKPAVVRLTWTAILSGIVLGIIGVLIATLVFEPPSLNWVVGILVGGLIGLVAGTLIGAYVGMMSRVRWGAERPDFVDVGSSSEQVVVVATVSGDDEPVRAVMRRHNALRFLTAPPAGRDAR
mgnify:CR=1 FL=1